jgi:hypothetical protein
VSRAAAADNVGHTAAFFAGFHGDCLAKRKHRMHSSPRRQNGGKWWIKFIA